MALIQRQVVLVTQEGEDTVMNLPVTHNDFVEGSVKSVNDVTPDENGNIAIGTALLDLFYPIGSIYQTTNADIDPNTVFGGTWEKWEDGRVLISANDTYVAGTTGGAATVTLTQNQIPSHTHGASSDSQGSHQHTRGDMNIVGSFAGHDQVTHDGAFSYISNVKYLCGHSHSGGANLGHSYFTAANNWSGGTSWNGAHSHTITVNNTGGGQAHNNMQPYRAVYMWHRTA